MKNFMRNYSGKLQQLLCLLTCVLMQLRAVSIRQRWQGGEDEM